jgi:hypothetical protein
MIHHAALATTLLMVFASAGAAQVIVRGMVINPDSARLPGVQIEIADSSGRIRHNATSDSAGRFAVRIAAPLTASRYIVRAERLGYQSARGSMDLQDREEVDVTIVMDVAAILIEPLRVVARRRYTRTSRDEYFDRLDRVRRFGGGTIIEYDQLQRRLGSPLMTVIAEQYPGARNCPPTYFIDGMRATNDDLRTLSVASVEGIEIYRTVGQVPVQYQSRGSCGAVLIWTQVGDRGQGSPLTWRRVLIAVGLLGIGFLLLR